MMKVMIEPKICFVCRSIRLLPTTKETVTFFEYLTDGLAGAFFHRCGRFYGPVGSHACVFRTTAYE
jgi:hypothetical protein